MLSGPQKSAYLASFGLPGVTFVETGTADHLNIMAVAPSFRHAYTIELDHGFYTQALWDTMEDPRITCIYGDSAEICEHLSYRLIGTVMWWLDAHYCGGVRGDNDTPVKQELEAIYKYRARQENWIFIDDARLFGTDPAYPTLDWITSFVEPYPMAHLYNEPFVQDDIIHILPKSVAR